MMTYKNTKKDIVEFSKKTLFFITAFIPLWTILIINYSFQENVNWYVVTGTSVFVIFSFLTLLAYLKSKRKIKDELNYFKISKKSEITHDVTFYILAYIPVLLIQKFEIQEITTVLILLFTIYVLYMKTNMLHVNPILALMKYKTYKVTDDHDNTVILISKLVVKSGIEVPYNEITHNLNIILDDQA